MKRLSPPRSGFTLVELLVVIGILAVLIAVVLPVGKTVRESARRAHCASNMRQIYQGALAYASRYDGALPGAVYGWMHDTVTEENIQSWATPMHREMFNYIDRRLYRCPGDESVSPYAPLDERDWRDDRPGTPIQTLNLSSYYIFMGVATHPDAFRRTSSSPVDWNLYPPLISPTGCKRGCIFDSTLFGKKPVHIANLKDVASPKQILFMDRWYSALQTGYYDAYASASGQAMKLVSNHPTKEQSPDSPIRVYGAGTNVLLADGSVRWMVTRGENDNSILNGKVRYHYWQDMTVTRAFVDMDLDPKLWRR